MLTMIWFYCYAYNNTCFCLLVFWRLELTLTINILQVLPLYLFGQSFVPIMYNKYNNLIVCIGELEEENGIDCFDPVVIDIWESPV